MKKLNFLQPYFTKQVKLVKNNLRIGAKMDGTAKFVMDCLEDKLSPELCKLLNEVLYGFDENMQLEIADNLLDFTCHRVAHMTGCVAVDRMLTTCYLWIGMEKGILSRKTMEAMMNEAIFKFATA